MLHYDSVSVAGCLSRTRSSSAASASSHCPLPGAAERTRPRAERRTGLDQKPSVVRNSQCDALPLQVLQNALAPERRTGLDQQLSVVPSVTHVYVSNDLQVGWLKP